MCTRLHGDQLIDEFLVLSAENVAQFLFLSPVDVAARRAHDAVLKLVSGEASAERAALRRGRTVQ